MVFSCSSKVLFLACCDRVNKPLSPDNDIIVIPGLGSDLYIDYMGTKYFYDERIVIHDIIEEIITGKKLNVNTVIFDK